MQDQVGQSDAMSSNDETFAFLELPKELRLNIYEYLHLAEYLELFSYDEPSVQHLTGDQLAQSRFYAWSVGKTLDVAILRTCKFMHSEAQNILYSPTTLELSPSVRDTGYKQNQPTAIMNATALSQLRQVEELKLNIIVTNPTNLTRSEDVVHSRALAKCLHHRVRLQTISLEILVGDTPEPSQALAEIFNA